MNDHHRQSKGYTLLALHIGRTAGLKMPTPAVVTRMYKTCGRSGLVPEKVAEAAHAVAAAEPIREQRDVLWMEYERMLRDTKTYQQKDVLEWLEAHEAKTSPASVNRDSMAVRAANRALQHRAALARGIIEAAENGETDFLKGARMLGAQALFTALEALSPEVLENLTAPQVLRLIESVGSFARDDAVTDLTAERLRQMSSTFDAELKKLQAKAAGGGGITDEEIANARKLVLGSTD